MDLVYLIMRNVYRLNNLSVEIFDWNKISSYEIENKSKKEHKKLKKIPRESPRDHMSRV